MRLFNLTVIDENDTANITLYRSTSTSAAGPWAAMSSQSYTSTQVGNSIVFNFTETFTCSLIDTWYFKFNVSNAVGNSNETIIQAPTNFTLTADNVYMYMKLVKVKHSIEAEIKLIY